MVTACDFQKAPGWRAVYKQRVTEAGFGIYVDDFELVASPQDTPKIWKQLETYIEFKSDYHVWVEETTRHLGC